MHRRGERAWVARDIGRSSEAFERATEKAIANSGTHRSRKAAALLPLEDAAILERLLTEPRQISLDDLLGPGFWVRAAIGVDRRRIDEGVIRAGMAAASSTDGAGLLNQG